MYFGLNLSPLHIGTGPLVKSNLLRNNAFNHYHLFLKRIPICGLGIEPTLIKFGALAYQIHHSNLESVLVCGYFVESSNVDYTFSGELLGLEFAFEFEQTVAMLFEAGFARYYNFHVIFQQ